MAMSLGISYFLFYILVCVCVGLAEYFFAMRKLEGWHWRTVILAVILGFLFILSYFTPDRTVWHDYVSVPLPTPIVVF
ncbi:hypothetical protein SY212_12760 [Ligilactobacillus agilis]|uniref:Uncharacterized protein n=1 Tax=Ligilactobacillus agilis TaxID=1601 RepID=A0A6F9XLX0_9LACO|nr:hypothetical protein [Ligilactobacillus agilis]MDM8279137.1 hypothetical protein [Ligilactobacillus agilis]GET06246.1 hypothetical protein SY212_12760 [Ligilactobacillus agilis]